jgi:hypothetical protein
MSLRENIIRIWKAKGQILEGVTNSIFKREDVEHIAEERMKICLFCDLYTENDDGCLVPGTTPCCNEKMGGCGCSLKFKIRSLSSECPMGHWKSEMTQEEEDLLNQKLGLN